MALCVALPLMDCAVVPLGRKENEIVVVAQAEADKDIETDAEAVRTADKLMREVVERVTVGGVDALAHAVAE